MAVKKKTAKKPPVKKPAKKVAKKLTKKPATKKTTTKKVTKTVSLPKEKETVVVVPVVDASGVVTVNPVQNDVLNS